MVARERVLHRASLLRTKLYIPQTRAGRVPRPRLIERLNTGLERKLTLLSAPAGFGKTTLLGEWLATLNKGQMPVAWVSLDERDNDLARFLIYVVAALDTLEAGLGPLDEALDRLHTQEPQPALVEEVLISLINQITEIPDDFALVLDDYHLVTAPAVHAALIFLLEHLPPQMHLVIASRTEPPLPLAHLRARGQLIELQAADLRFTRDEVAAFLNQVMGLGLSVEDVAALEARTEGWIAGLQLAALAMPASLSGSGPEAVSDFIKAFTGNHRYVLDYLAEQVLRQQPEHVQSFLLQTSILDRLSGPLCDAVTGQTDGQAMLERLEHANLFIIPLDGERRWYRYHHLFADFLRERLRQAMLPLSSSLHTGGKNGGPPELHRRAAEWYERNGLIAEAVGHALAVGDAEQAVRLVEQIAESSWMRGEMTRLLGWLEALPDELIRSRPRLCIFHAWILNILGRFEAVHARLQDAEEALGRSSEAGSENQKVIRGMLATVRAIVAIMEDDIPRVMELSRQARELLPADNWVWRSVVIRNLGNAYLLTGQTLAASQAFNEAIHSSQMAGNVYMTVVAMYELAELQIIQGQLRAAAQTCREALQLVAERGSPGLLTAGALHIGLSEVLREWNELEEGTRHALAGIELGRQGRSLGIQVCGYTRLGMLALARGDMDGASRAFRTAAQLAPTQRRTSFLAHHDSQARLWGWQGDLAAAAHWTQTRGLSVEGELSYMNEAAYITLARVLLAQSKLEEALRLLERLREAAEAAGRVGRLIEILALQAVAFKTQGAAGRALATLRQALSLAEPEGYLRVFVDEGEPMKKVMSHWRLEIEKNQPYDEMLRRLITYTDKLLAAFPNNVPHLPITNYQSYPDTPQPPTSNLHAKRPTANRQSPLVEPLSERELEILRLIAAGLTSQEIAQQLVVALSTVHWHLKNIYGKLDVHSRTQAVARAQALSLLR